MEEAEQFRLALKGWKYKATLNDWYFQAPESGALAWGLNIVGEDGVGTVEIPPMVIEEKRRVDGKVVIFLKNGTCYELGTERDEN